MKNIMMLGLGAIGTCVASRFIDNGESITALCDEQRKQRYEKDGFIINGKRYDFDYATPESYGKVADLIIVATKYHHLREAIKDIDKVIDDNTVILSILNGVDSEEIIGEKTGIEKVLCGYIYRIDAQKTGNVCNFSAKEIIAYGEAGGGISDRVLEVEKAFNRAGVICEPEEDILTSMWWKYMVNIGANQVSCTSKANYETLTQFKPTWELAEMAMRECVMVAKAKGVKLDESSIKRAYDIICELHPDGKTSMYQDVMAKRKTEVEMLGMNLSKMGKELGIETPVNDVLVRQIQTIEHLY